MHRIDGSERRALLRMDLNLLVALDALLSAGSVTAAARQLGRTQSATSHALSRLRIQLGDELLVRSGRGLVPTSRALELRPHVEETLRGALRVLAPPDTFDPSTTHRTMTLACPDLLTPLVPALLKALRVQAPEAMIAHQLPRAELGTQLAEGSVDIAIGARPSLGGAGVTATTLGSVRFVVVARRGHPALRRGRAKLTPESWAAYPHVVVRTGSPTPNLLEAALKEARLRRTIGLVVPSFLTALHVVADTDLFFAAPREIVESLSERLDLEMRPLPVDFAPIRVAMFWHERFTHDPANRWLRELVAKVVQQRLTRARTVS